MSSSESECDSDKEFIARLGNCEVCDKNAAKYTCPKCEVKTCCLQCVVIHKKELECNGIRDRTRFVRMKDFNNTDLLSDYRLLEECARFVYAVKRDEKKKFTRLDKDLPIHLFKLKMAARKRGIVIQFLAQNFSRHLVNTTRYNYKTNIIHWRVEWIFPNVEKKPLKFVDEKCSEQTRLSVLLDKYLNPESNLVPSSKELVFYRSAGFRGVKVLLKAEKVKSSDKKFFELDQTESLAENLCGKCIIEFPIIFIVLKDHAYNFDIIIPEDEPEYINEANFTSTKSNVSRPQFNENNQENLHSNMSNKLEENKGQIKQQRPLLTEKIAYEKRLEIEKEIKLAKKRKPKNLLFTTGYSSEESICSDTDDDEIGNVKKIKA